MQDWRLQSPARALIKIKEFLNSEMQKAEWEVLDSDVGGAENEEAVVVGGKRLDTDQAAAKGAANANSGRQESEAKTARAQRSQQTSEQARDGSTGAQGYVKVRNRTVEDKA